MTGYPSGQCLLWTVQYNYYGIRKKSCCWVTLARFSSKSMQFLSLCTKFKKHCLYYCFLIENAHVLSVLLWCFPWQTELCSQYRKKYSITLLGWTGYLFLRSRWRIYYLQTSLMKYHYYENLKVLLCVFFFIQIETEIDLESFMLKLYYEKYVDVFRLLPCLLKCFQREEVKSNLLTKTPHPQPQRGTAYDPESSQFATKETWGINVCKVWVLASLPILNCNT